MAKKSGGKSGGGGGGAKRTPDGKIEYRGEKFDGYNKPKRTPGEAKKYAVLAKDGDQVKLIRFGDANYGHNYSEEARKSYLARSAGIRDKDGNLTKDDKLSANYWARKVLWAGESGEKRQPPK